MKKLLLLGAFILLSLAGLFVYQYNIFHDGKLHLIFCDVGQGDAILVKTPSNKFILIDGGPDRAVLNCLARHMPFWEKNIDLMLLTHPHADHFFGMFYILDRYHVGGFAMESLVNKITSFEAILQSIQDKHIPQRRVGVGDLWKVGSVTFLIVGPDESYLQQTSPGGTIGESKEFASLVTEVSYGSFHALLTGDSQAIGLRKAMENVSDDITILQSPHHGSGTGLDAELLQSINPHLAVISVGAKNRYGHPSQKTLELFKKQGVKVLRTDQVGDVEIVSDGKGWRVY